MIRHQYSYWLRLEGPVAVRKSAHEWLHEHGTCPDFLRLVVSEEPDVSTYEVPSGGTIEESPDIWDAISGLAIFFPALCVYLDEFDEEDHSVERHTYWHDGKIAQEYGEHISNELLKLKAEDPEQYRVQSLAKQFKKALLNRGDSADKAERLALALANGSPETGKGTQNNIYFHLSVEGNQDDCLVFSQSLCQHPVLMRKAFLWPVSQQVGLYVGRGNEKTAKEVIGDITTAVAALPNLIVFLEEDREPTTCSRWHCWNSNRHAFIEANDGLLYESKLDLRDLLLDLCKHPERYPDSFSETAQVEDITPKTGKEETYDVQIPRLAGGFCLVKSIDTDNPNDVDLPVLIAVKEDSLLAFVNEKGYDSLEEFYSKYTAKSVGNLERWANYAGKMAFSFHTGTGEFMIPTYMKNDGVFALIDFISGKLQENGFTDASKYLDCLFEL